MLQFVCLMIISAVLIVLAQVFPHESRHTEFHRMFLQCSRDGEGASRHHQQFNVDSAAYRVRWSVVGLPSISLVFDQRLHAVCLFQKDRDGGEQALPGKAASAEKQAKGADSGKPGGRDLQVEAAMKRFPLLLPRRPDKALLPVHSLPPAPKDMKVTLPITMPTTLPVMILPTGMSLSYHERERPPPAVTVPATPAPGAVQRSRAAPKRTAEPVPADGAVGGAGTPPKRKRGRPRKPRPEETAQPAPTTPTPAVPVSGGVIQKALPASAVPSQQPRPEVMELLIQEDPAPATVLDLGTEDAAGASHRLLTLQHNATAATPQAMPYPVLLLPGAGHPLKPVVSPGWEGGRAAVEVIRRAPVARENRSQAEAPAAALDTLLENKEVQISLTPVDSLSEPLLTSEPESDCPQPGASGQVNIP